MENRRYLVISEFSENELKIKCAVESLPKNYPNTLKLSIDDKVVYVDSFVTKQLAKEFVRGLELQYGS